MTTKITEASISLWAYCLANLPRTPMKFHYMFNLRDLSSIYQGLCRSRIDKYKTLNDFVKLWRNEATRTFVDKLCDLGDVEKVSNYIPELVKGLFPNCAGDDMDEPMIYGDFAKT